MRESPEHPAMRYVKHPLSLQNTQNTKHMKTHILALLCSLAITITGYAHSGVERGPNGGRLLEFSKDETMHGEVTVKDGKFVIELLDKSKKPVALGEQTLTASGGPSGKAAKLAVEKKDGKFVVPIVKDGDWLIVQFKADSKAKSVTARLHYDIGACDGCKKPEWLCECPPAKDAKK